MVYTLLYRLEMLALLLLRSDQYIQSGSFIPLVFVAFGVKDANLVRHTHKA